jgi:distribution and morphology protein 31
MSWITSGKLDAVLDIKFPHHPDDEVDIKAIFEEIGRNVATITSQGMHPDESPPTNVQAGQMADAVEKSAGARQGVIPGQHRLARPPLRAPSRGDTATGGVDEVDEVKRKVTIDIDLRFRDLKAAVPIYTSDLSVTNNAFIRPIVAFIK